MIGVGDVQCRNCGDVVDPERSELGYDYCMKDECQKRCMRRIEMATVGVNKAADQFVRAEEVRPSASRLSYSRSTEGETEGGPSMASNRPRSALRREPAESGLNRLRRAEARLDIALSESYDRFSRGATTAREMKVERNKLIRAFNSLVRAENIRYRARLRPELPD
ncbi:MAG: hypothetical protein E6G39_11615 [Actinobacteria bacterium]|nr:MAG: hypothetical protein E6G39_11615 [Actinomycetota bacterium]